MKKIIAALILVAILEGVIIYRCISIEGKLFFTCRRLLCIARKDITLHPGEEVPYADLDCSCADWQREYPPKENFYQP